MVVSYAPMDARLSGTAGSLVRTSSGGTRVLSTNIGHALRCQFLPTAIVLKCSSTGAGDNVRTLRDRFPKIPIIVLRHNGDAAVDPREGYRLDPILRIELSR